MNESIAFAIAGSIVTRDVRQKHIGLIYRNQDSKIMLLHLAWHHKLIKEEWDGKYHWLELKGLDRELQETFADWAEIVSNAGEETPIPYSVIFRSNKNFDPTGRFIDLKDGSGLTCATFILSLFNDFNLPLIDSFNWPESRKGDLTWLRRILKYLKINEVLNNTMSKSVWYEQFKQRHRLKRFRPEEVFATASLFSGNPLSFHIVENAGSIVNQKIPP